MALNKILDEYEKDFLPTHDHIYNPIGASKQDNTTTYKTTNEEITKNKSTFTKNLFYGITSILLATFAYDMSRPTISGRIIEQHHDEKQYSIIVETYNDNTLKLNFDLNPPLLILDNSQIFAGKEHLLKEQLTIGNNIRVKTYNRDNNERKVYKML